eukprot:CAMPEP_0198244796 /NCGR_PEP_ID=MMETSP1446-20131203/37490_1 /TAXON_ID=1461542 ORGANISM="Unidentified sp, Strain CCMP2111" /NCGR_SAMPLE_ID=MMETSP1446 /ASSEMBLY_ACC=CAM_ASM_001112 /LENGTH=242 /DNA_ID=CAMNT_0043928895 /DNA_START=30 /DNA_END=758 /DNA_ORIENTATION=-
MGTLQLDCMVHRDGRGDGLGSVGVIISHPYPLLGGCMLDHVCQEIFQAFAREGCNTVLAYNSRGIGRSTGRPSLRGGAKESEDLRALVSALQRFDHPPERFVLIGYSYGACVTFGAISSIQSSPGGSHVDAIVAVSPPIGGFAATMLGTKHLWQNFLSAKSVKKLVCMGTSDQYTSTRQLDTKLRENVPDASAGGSGPSDGTRASPLPSIDTKIYDGGNHFWTNTSGLHQMVRDLVLWVGAA